MVGSYPPDESRLPLAPEMRERLLELFADVFQIDVDAEADDVTRDEVPSWDSFNHIRLVMDVEEAFLISISDEEGMELRSLRDIEALLARRGEARLPELEP